MHCALLMRASVASHYQYIRVRSTSCCVFTRGDCFQLVPCVLCPFPSQLCKPTAQWLRGEAQTVMSKCPRFCYAKRSGRVYRHLWWALQAQMTCRLNTDVFQKDWWSQHLHRTAVTSVAVTVNQFPLLKQAASPTTPLRYLHLLHRERGHRGNSETRSSFTCFCLMFEFCLL